MVKKVIVCFDLSFHYFIHISFFSFTVLHACFPKSSFGVAH